MSTLVKRNGFFPSTSFFDDFLTRDLFDWSNWTDSSNSTVPRVNIVESNDDFRVEMAAPGMKKDDFHVELDNDMLTIYSEVQNEQTNEDKNYTRREFSYQSFRRSFHLPNTVEADKIEATYKDGLLSLVIPKKEEAKKKPARTIAIS
ncbi:MAG: Hsp20/alpha crystallin family protein [Ekhidna sp.]